MTTLTKPKVLTTFFLLCTCVQSARAVVYVSGTVKVKATGAAVAGLRVSLYPAGLPPGEPDISIAPLGTCVTQANGAYVIKAAGAGRYRMWAAPAGYAPVSQDLNVPSRGLARLDLTLAAEPVLQVRVLKPDGHLLNSGKVAVWVWLLWGDSAGLVLPAPSEPPLMAEQQAPASGILRVVPPPELPVQNATAIRIDVQAIGLGVGSVNLGSWSDRPVTVQLGPGAVVTGTVLNAAEKPAAGKAIAAIRLLQDRLPVIPMELSKTVTDAGGHFAFSNLFPERYEIVEVSSANPRSRVVALSSRPDSGKPSSVLISPKESDPAPDEALLSFVDGHPPLSAMLERLDPARARVMADLAGRVVDTGTGKGIPGALVALLSRPEGEPVSLDRSGPDGSFRLRGPRSRAYILRVEDPAHLVFQRPLWAPRQSLPPLRVRLRRTPEIKVTILLPNGSPLARGSVEAYASVDWGEGLTETSVERAVSSLGAIAIPSPRTTAPGGQTTTGEPAAIVIGVRSPSYGYGEAHLNRWPEGSVKIRLGRAGTLSGLVLNASGRPMPHVALSLERSAHYPGREDQPLLPIAAGAVTGPAGRFEVRWLPPGTYSIEAPYGGTMVRAAIIALAGDRTAVTVRPPVK